MVAENKTPEQAQTSNTPSSCGILRDTLKGILKGTLKDPLNCLVLSREWGNGPP